MCQFYIRILKSINCTMGIHIPDTFILWENLYTSSTFYSAFFLAHLLNIFDIALIAFELNFYKYELCVLKKIFADTNYQKILIFVNPIQPMVQIFKHVKYFLALMNKNVVLLIITVAHNNKLVI